jgi:ABC-2 type transport system permease protein
MRGNLATVVAFEVRRTLRSKVFWMAALVVPVLFAVVVLLMEETTAQATGSTASPQPFSWEYVDDSGLIVDSVAQTSGGTKIASADRGLDDVLSGTTEGFIHYPADPTTQTTIVAGQDVGIVDSDRYTAMAIGVLQASAAAAANNPGLVAIASGDIPVRVTTYTAGQPSGGVGGLIPPLIFLAALYLVIIMQGNRMLSSSLEEKENRVTEMILTTIKSSSLLAGKVVSLVVVGLVQMLVTVAPITVVLVVLRDKSAGGSVLSSLVFDPVRMAMGAVLLLAGFLLFTAGCVAIGAAMPTIKDANAMFTVVILVLLLPLFVFSLIMTSPDTSVVRVFTYFPLTAPVTGLVRNAFGSLVWWQCAVEVVLVLAVTWGIFVLAARIYRFGSVEYDRKIDVRRVLVR